MYVETCETLRLRTQTRLEYRAGSDLESGVLNWLFPTLSKKRQRTDDQRLHRNWSSFFVSDGGIKRARGTHAHISPMQCGYHLTSAHNRWDKYHVWAVQLELTATLTQALVGLSRTKLSRAKSMLSIRHNIGNHMPFITFDHS